MDETPDPTPPNEERKPGVFQIIGSILAAAVGVQSDANRQRDFTQGHPLVYIVGGLIFTAIFVLTLVGIVMLVVR